jgi:hypothetical protein
MHSAARALAALLPAADLEALPGQQHDVSADALVPALDAFFGARVG